MPVCDCVISLRLASVRPSLSAMIGLPACRARAAAAKNASGRRIFSSASAMTRVAVVVDEEVEVVGHVRHGLVARRDQAC